MTIINERQYKGHRKIQFFSGNGGVVEVAIRDEEEVLYDDINKCSVAVAIYGRGWSKNKLY